MAETTLATSEIQFANADFLPEVVKMLNQGHTVTLRLRGFSMRPFLENDRDKALLVKPSAVKWATPSWQKSPKGTMSCTASTGWKAKM